MQRLYVELSERRKWRKGELLAQMTLLDKRLIVTIGGLSKL